MWQTLEMEDASGGSVTGGNLKGASILAISLLPVTDPRPSLCGCQQQLPVQFSVLLHVA